MVHRVQRFVVLCFCIVAAGCSTSSSPGSNNSNNNNGGGNAVGIVGPSVGSVYIFSTTEKDMNGTSYHQIIYDTALVVADTITFQGRTNVTQIRDKYYDASLYPSPTIYFGTSYYGYDANGDFYKYDTTYPFQGWHHYPTGSQAVTTVQLDPQGFGTDTIWGLTATASYTGTGVFTVGSQLVPTEDVHEVSKQNLLLIDDYIGLFYVSSFKFYVELIDTLNNTNQVGTGAVNPLIYSHTLNSYSLK